MNNKQKFIAGAMALTLITSTAPMSVSAKAKAKAPAKVTVTSAKESKQYQDYRKVEEAEEEHLRLCGICESRL